MSLCDIRHATLHDSFLHKTIGIVSILHSPTIRTNAVGVSANDCCYTLMSQRSYIFYILIGFGTLFFILHLGIILSFPSYDPSPVQRKFLVQYVDPTLTQQTIGTGTTSRTFTPHDNLEPIPRPPLSSLVQGWNVTGNVSWLIQFSIIGFPKSGTSTLMFHLRDHPEIHMFPHERCELAYNRPTILIEDLYRQFPSSSDASHRFVRGIKCPMELENRQLSLHNYQKLFPKTDFIVGIRHPILWFESFYNFRMQNKFPMPPAETLIGRCRRGWNNVCTNRANFHVFLSNLGKTNITTDSDEMQYVNVEMRKAIDPMPMMTRKVFLYDVSQLSDRDTARSLQFRNDLQHFLHLKEPISPFIWFKPGQNLTTDSNDVNTGTSNKIDICEAQYDKLREVLLRHSTQASQWIRKYFIHADGVIVSSKTYLEHTLLKTWEVDPCVDRKVNVGF